MLLNKGVQGQKVRPERWVGQRTWGPGVVCVGLDSEPEGTVEARK